MRLATALGALAIGAGGLSVTTLPRPAFPGPAAAPGGPHRLALVSSRYQAPGNLENDNSVIQLDGLPTLRGLQLVATIAQPATLIGLYGTDLGSARVMVIKRTEQTGIDLKNYVWPPRFRPGERTFVYESIEWAQYWRGVLYVENAHATYARSSYGQNAYITAIDLKTRTALWRSPALVANANTFLVTPHYLLTGYGFTDERDYLYVLDRATGRVVDRLSLPTAPEQIGWHSGLLRIRTYDHVVLARLRGA